MIRVIPIRDETEEKAFLAREGLQEGNLHILRMTDGDELLGWAAVELNGSLLRIVKLAAGSYDFSQSPNGEESFILDTLMRSAASYGENGGAQRIETAFPDFFGFFKRKGFDTEDGFAKAPMSVIVQYH